MSEIPGERSQGNRQNAMQLMTSARTTGDAPRMSFASVAAMAARTNSYQPRGLDTMPSSAESSNGPLNSTNHAGSPKVPAMPQSHDDAKGLTDSLRRLDVRGDHLRQRLDDERTHLSVSSTTAPSLDGKSVTSGTTFALDEKESIRPDDSASVKAAEDDDSNSGPASGDPNSRYGSEAGGKAFPPEISERVPTTMRNLQWVRRLSPIAIEEARRGPLAPPNTLSICQPELAQPDNQPSGEHMVYDYPQPDEKLLEALENPKDRIFLLQLEKQVISFIQDSNEPLLDLPPCNSFYRLLAHRLGDYYALSHFVDNSVSAVRLYRTPYCRLRTSLSEIAQKLSSSEESRPMPLSMKIMRRTEGSGEDQPPSSSPSKAASEVEDEGSKPWSVTSPADSTTARDKPAISREEREAKYREARERIFGDYKEGEKTDTNVLEEGGVPSSRASSTTSRKKKKTRAQDDGFDSRSAYNLYYPTSQRSMPFYDHSANQMNYYNPYIPQSGGPVMPMAYQHTYTQYPSMPTMGQMSGYQYATPTHYQMLPIPGIYGPPGQQLQYNQYPQQPRSLYFPPGTQPQQLPGAPNSMPSPSLSNHSSQSSRPPSQLSEQNWLQTGYGYPYNNLHSGAGTYQPSPHLMNQPQQPTPPPGYTVPSVPYAYGQLPYQPNGQGIRPMHPIPGSYNRQHFNPQSKIFVPGQGTGMEMIGGHSPSTNSPPQQGSAGKGTASISQPSPRKNAGSNQPPKSPPQDTISKWATPPTLPPKPPPPASEGISSNFEGVEVNLASRNGKFTRTNHSYSKS